MARATVLVLALILGASPAASATPAKQLGAAFDAFKSGDFDKARTRARRIDRRRLSAAPYASYVAGQAAYLTGRYGEALAEFRALARGSSRFKALARWRVADCLWQLSHHKDARVAYEKLIRASKRRPRDAVGDMGLARFRVAEAFARAQNRSDAIAGFRRVMVRHPAHPLAERARRRLVELAGPRTARLSADDRIARAMRLNDAKRWRESIAELAQIPDSASAEQRRRRDYWTGMTLFKMRRQYKRAGDLLLGLYKGMGSDAAKAMFHGARALSRADFDEDAIRWYQRVVAEYPRSRRAAEAQFLSGWLKFNMGKYRDGIPYLEKTLSLYGRTKWSSRARWYLGLSHFLLGEFDAALRYFERIARKPGRLEGGRGRYWVARSHQQLGRKAEAIGGYRELVGAFPFSWYALLATARLKTLGVYIGPFGDRPQGTARAPDIALRLKRGHDRDPLIRLVDELIGAGLTIEAGHELRRGERAFLRRHDKPVAMATLLHRYRKAGNYNRPWMLAVVHGGQALRIAPKGKARRWWEHAYPRAFGEIVARWQHLGDSPDHYLHAIMRKESGFDPHTHSYANAIGLLQMIPMTTRQVVSELGLEYTDDLLFDPELNVRTGSWYIGRLLKKFKGQIPFGAGSFNSGPRPVMRWLDKNGDRPVDEFVELVSYNQTRGYMKKVTETYARYVYLYEGQIYRQPLVVDRNYVKNKLTY